MKKVAHIIVKTVSERHSWIIFNCIRLNGPPLMLDPILLAGTITKYSRRATPQESRMITIRGQLSEMCISESFNCPYQAIVIKMLETTNNSMVQSP